MRIALCIGIRVMHPVHDSIRFRAHIRRSLGDICENIKDPFPEPVHLEGPVRCITMLQEGLGKQRQVPDGNKKNNDDHKKEKNDEKVVR